MKKIYNLLVLGICLLGLNMAAQSDEEKAWMAYMTPGEAHKMLAEEVGEWDCEMKFWMAPGAPAQTYKTTAEINMILGGRYQTSNYKGMIMGMPFEGKATVGFDNATKEYVSTWMDNMGTGIMVMKGNMKKGSNVIHFSGEGVDPATGKKIKMREVYTIIDENTRKLEMFDDKTGKEAKTMEIIMKRK